MEPLRCADQRMVGGEGRINADLWVATDRFRAVLRHPESALTIAHVGGMSLLDLGSWPDGVDRVHEAVPLVEGGWLDVDDWWLDGTTVLMEGIVVSLPDQVAPGEGRRVTVRWVFEGDTIRAEGADGFYVHPRGLVTRDARSLSTADLVIRDDGTELDLGGAVRVRGNEFVVDRPEAAWARGDDLVEVLTTASELELQWEGEVVGRVPVDPEAPSVWVEAVDAVRATSPRTAPGPWVPLDAAVVEAPLGAEGLVDLVLPGERGAIVHWSFPDGRSGDRTMGPEGGLLGLGAGLVTLSIDPDPRRQAWTLDVEIGEGETVEVEVPRRGAAERSDWALVLLGAPSDRNRSWRGTDNEAVRRAHAAGFDAAAFLVEDDTTTIDPWALAQLPLVAHGGLVRRGVGPEGPWRIDAWPVDENTRKNAHGAVGGPTDDPLVALTSAWGGDGTPRHLRVDLPTLAALGPAHTLPVLPDLVLLDAPDDDLGNWGPWLDRLAEGRTLVPTGPVTWAKVADRTRLTLADVDQALFAGEVSAGSGPRVTLERSRRGVLAQGRIDGGHTLELWTDRGLLHRTDAPTLRWPDRPDARWVLAVLRSGPEWAVAGPVWLVDPATGAPLESERHPFDPADLPSVR